MQTFLKFRWVVLAATTFLVNEAATAGELARVEAVALDRVDAALQKLGGIPFDIGVTRAGNKIPARIQPQDLDLGTPLRRVLLVGGLEGSSTTVEGVLEALAGYEELQRVARLRHAVVLSAVPLACPSLSSSTEAANPSFPPRGKFYQSPDATDAMYLWRWIGLHAPDLVVEVALAPEGSGNDGTAATPRWQLPAELPVGLSSLLKPLAAALGVAPNAPPAPVGSLAHALTHDAPAGVGRIPALRVEIHPGSIHPSSEAVGFPHFFEALQRSDFRGPSPARAELQRRDRRTPMEVAQELSSRYGHQLDGVSYIPALALIGRLRLGELLGDAASLRDVERIVQPYVSGVKASLGEKPSGSRLAGHLVFAELAHRTGGRRYAELARGAADLGFDASGAPLEAMPSHNEMSDGVFMACPLLVTVGRLSGEERYYDLALRHLKFLQALDLRGDGLYRHSPLDEAAWGRGNGFPALGVALALSDLPDESPHRGKFLTALREHLAALKAHQDVSGAWHQVIDHSGSYRELTSTCMITFAMLRGLRRGWLDSAEYLPVVERAWSAIRRRVGVDGALVDVCAGTGKQRSLRAYLDRHAIQGEDARGGAMALLVSVERAAWERERTQRDGR